MNKYMEKEAKWQYYVPAYRRFLLGCALSETEIILKILKDNIRLNSVGFL